MRTDANIFMFLSTEFDGMCAFSANSEGISLPAQFAPWLGFGVVRPDQQPPHGLSRAAIESGIDKNGYQLWRRKKSQKAASTASTIDAKSSASEPAAA